MLGRDGWVIYRLKCHLRNRNQLRMTLRPCNPLNVGTCFHFFCVFRDCYWRTEVWCRVWRQWDPFLCKLERRSRVCWQLECECTNLQALGEEKVVICQSVEFFEVCPANWHPLPIFFVYFLSVLHMTGTSTQYALHDRRERDRLNIALKRKILHWKF